MHSSNDAAQQPSLKHADLFSFPPDTEKRPPRLPHHKSQTLNRPESQLASIVRKAPSIPKQVIPQPSPGILTPHQQGAPRAPSFPPQRHKGDRAGRLGQVPVLSFQNHSAARRPPLPTLRRSEATGAFMREDVLETKYGTRPNRPVGSEYPCCYSALPTELRLVMRILTSSVISRMPSLAGFLGSKQAGFSAM